MKSFHHLLVRLMFALAAAGAAFLPPAVHPASACEIFIPPNYLYEERLDLDESRFPPALVAHQEPPAWVTDDGLVGYVQFENSGSDDLYLLFSFYIEPILETLENGQKVDSSIWTQGLAIPPGGTFDIVGEGNLMQFAPGLEGRNVSNTSGDPRIAPAEPPAVQHGRLYFVAKQKLTIVPFTITYEPNPNYSPDGTFHPLTLEERVAQTPVIVLGVAESGAPEGEETASTVQVERWLKGSGPERITVDGFGFTSCDYQVAPGQRAVFFLRPEGAGYRLNDLQAGMFTAMVDPAEAAQVTAITGQESVRPAAVESPTAATATPSSPEAEGASLPQTGNLAPGLFLVIPAVLLAGAAVWWRRNRRGRSGGI